MHQVATRHDPEVSSDGPGRRVGRIGHPDEATDDLPGVEWPLEYHHHYRATGHELNRGLVEGLAHVLAVVSLNHRPLQVAHLCQLDGEELAFKARQDLTDQSALNAVRLDDDQSSIHDDAI